MLDGYGRNIRYARISVTDLCNLKCRYCKPRPVPKLRHEDILSVDEIITLGADLCNKAGFTKIRLTGGEPLVRKGIVPIVRGICAVCPDVGITTNGVLLKDYALELRSAGISRVNVSLDTVDPATYREVSGGDLRDVLSGIAAAAEADLKIKLNAVLQRGVNDDPLPLAEYADSIGAKLRFIELMPFASTLDYVNDRALNAEEWAQAHDMEFIGADGKTARYSYRGKEIGIIAAVSRNFCKDCDRIRITSTGMLLPCLHGAEAYPLRDKIGSADFTEYLRSVLERKPLSHGILEDRYQKIDMGSIGG